MTRIDHAAEIRARLTDPSTVVDALGLGDHSLRQAGGRTVLCPVHAERSPSCSITRGPDGTIRFRCFGCEATGDVLDLVATVKGLSTEHDFKRVLEEAARIAGYDLGVEASGKPLPPRPVPPKPPERKRPPIAEVEALWAASQPVNDAGTDAQVALFLSARRLFPPAIAQLDVVRVTPVEYEWPAWWRANWARSWRLITRAFEPDGSFGSLHARAVDESTPKTRWPFDCAADGLLFADARGQALLRGQVGDTDRIVFVEGLTDFVAMASVVRDAGRRHAVWGITSGSAPALTKIRWPRLPVVVATDSDVAGQRYAAEVERRAPKSIRVARWAAPQRKAG
jgi:hypothetical protein